MISLGAAHDQGMNAVLENPLARIDTGTLLARYDQLVAWERLEESTLGRFTPPIDDPDDVWNSSSAIDDELGRRPADDSSEGHPRVTPDEEHRTR